MPGVPGKGGPPPKRSSQRRRRNKDRGEVETVEVSGDVEMPAGDESWDPLALDLYRSLGQSGQALFYEPSDWQIARNLCRLLSDEYQRGSGPRAVMVQTILSGLSDLLVTEGDRRRVRMELERGGGEDDGEGEASVSELDEHRARLRTG